MTYKKAIVQTSYGAIYTKQLGNLTENNVLVFLHDAIGSASIWGSFPEKVHAATGFPALVFDRLGYGKSEADPKPREVHYLEYEAMVRLPELLEQLKVRNPILIGHSDGGTIALVYAARFETKAVVSMAAHIYEEEITREGIHAFFQRSNFLFLKEKLQKHHRAKTEKVLYAWRDTWLSADFAKWDVSHFLNDISCATLIIQGKQDEYGTDLQVLDIARLLVRKPEVVFIEECGHVPYKEKQDEVLELISKFLIKLFL